MDSVAALVGKKVIVVTLEGRNLIGTLKGYDLKTCNLVLENTFERTFHLDRGMQLEPMGLYLVRGDSL
jgi:small nuclear ribonucleoprotein (snRNP)-like protein